MEYTMYCCQINLGRYSGRLPGYELGVLKLMRIGVRGAYVPRL